MVSGTPSTSVSVIDVISSMYAFRLLLLLLLLLLLVR
jgi:hypothetical protein